MKTREQVLAQIAAIAKALGEVSQIESSTVFRALAKKALMLEQFSSAYHLLLVIGADNRQLKQYHNRIMTLRTEIMDILMTLDKHSPPSMN